MMITRRIIILLQIGKEILMKQMKIMRIEYKTKKIIWITTMIEIYWFIAIAVIVLGLIMPQQGPKRKYYIIIMAAIHTFVCGFRYQYLTGDLQA